MEKRSVGVGITGVSMLAAVVALAFRPGPTIPPSEAPQVLAASVPKEEARSYPSPESAIAGYDRGRELLAEYFGNSWETLVASADSAAKSVPTSAGGLIPLRITIAAIPDPFDSYLDWAYDANLEAMRRAFDATGWRPYEFWLPQRIDSVRVTENGVARRLPAHDLEPGVLLFRSLARDSLRLHLLYLVPEVPTAGLHPMAFRAALTERRAIMMKGKSIFSFDERERAELSILGPNFSGSSISLRAMVDASLADATAPAMLGFVPRMARIVSGSATAFANETTLTDTTKLLRPARVTPARDTLEAKMVDRIEFSATVNPDEAMDAVVDRLVQGLGLRSNQVALLTESGTGYGASRMQRAADRIGYLTAPFPLNIGSLRRAFEQSNAAQSSASVPGMAEAPRTRLSFDERARGSETPPLLSDLSVPTLDVVLGSLIQTLNEHDVRMVIIKATDVRDKMMLARELRRGLPDVLLVIYEGHALLRRAEYADALRGAIVVSTYPLALENQFWATSHRSARGDETRTQLGDLLAFPTDASIGVYNAMLTLLDQPRDRLEFSMHSGQDAEQELPVPPVWLSVIGRDGFYPLLTQPPDMKWWGYLGVDTSASNISDVSGGRPHDHSDTHDDVSLSVLIIVPILLITTLLTMLLVGRDALLALGLNVPPSLERPDSARQSLFLALFLLSLVTTYLPLSVAVDARRIVGSLDPFSGGASGALWFVLALATIIFAVGAVLLVYGLVGIVRSRQVIEDPPGSGTMMPTPKKNVSVRVRVSTLMEKTQAPSHVTRVKETVTPTETLYEYRRLTTRHEAPFFAKGGAFVVALINIAFLGCSVTFTIHLIRLSHRGGTEAAISLYRAMHVGSGVSPLVPLVILGLGFALWSWWQLQQARTFDHHDPFESGVRLLAHKEKTETIWRRLYRGIVDARRGLSWMVPGLGVVVIVLGVSGTAWFVARRRLSSLEHMADVHGPEKFFDAAFWIGVLGLMLASWVAIYRLAHTWQGLRKFLDTIAGTPLANAFARLTPDIANISELGFFGSHRDERDDEAHAEELWSLVTDRAKELEGSVGAPSMTSGTTWARVAAPELASHRYLRVESAFDALRDEWEQYLTRPSRDKDVPMDGKIVPDALGRVLRTMEEYIAYEVVLFVDRYLSNLRRLCLFLFVSLLILVSVSAQYPYQPRSVVSLASVVLLIATVASVFWVMFSLSRNETISRISRTEPGKVTWDTTFIMNAVTFGVIPLLALVSSEFPAVRSFLFSWAEPLVRAVART